MPPKKLSQQQKLSKEKSSKKKETEKEEEDNEEEEKEDEISKKQKISKEKVESQEEKKASEPKAENSCKGNGKFSSKKILISTWNINGIRAVLKKGEPVGYMKKRKPDIFCINESKVDEDNFAKEKIGKEFPAEYHQYWNFCKPPQKGYAGTALFSLVEPISVQYDLGISKHDQEGRTITAEYENFYLVACYVPNAGQGLKRLDYRVKEWDIDFQKYLNKLKQKKHVILCGDLNVAHKEIDIFNAKGNLKSAGFTVEERESFTKYLESGWIDTFREKYPKVVKYSYWNQRSAARSKNQGWRLDYFIIDKEGYKGVNDSMINNDIEGSDHCPIELDLDLEKL